VKITFLLKNPVKGYFPLTPLNSYAAVTLFVSQFAFILKY